MASMAVKDRPVLRHRMLIVGIFGTCLFYGDGVITPAISVLSAVEGLELVTPAFKPFIVPLSLVIIVGLFVLQRKGTASVGALFGPIMVVWFLTISVLGFHSIAKAPQVLWAINPAHGASFLIRHGAESFFVMGSVVLVDLRMLGVALPSQHPAELLRRWMPWFWWSLPAGRARAPRSSCATRSGMWRSATDGTGGCASVRAWT